MDERKRMKKAFIKKIDVYFDTLIDELRAQGLSHDEVAEVIVEKWEKFVKE